MLRDKRMLRGTRSLTEASKSALRPRTLQSGSISGVESDNSSKTGACAWGGSGEEAASKLFSDVVSVASCDDMMLLEDTSANFISLSDGKRKSGDNFAAVSSSNTGECHLSKLTSSISASVVSLALFKKGKEGMLLKCTGVCIECSNSKRASILTSINLVASCVRKRKISGDFVIKVRLPDNRLVNGFLEYCDFYYGIAVVCIKNLRGRPVKPFILDPDIVLESSEVEAVWRCFDSGELKTITGKLIGSTNGKVRELVFSTCKITMAGIGSALIGVGGKFVGMNCCNREMTEDLLSKRKSTPCIQSNIILRRLQHTGILSVGTKEGGDGTGKGSKRKMQKSSALDDFNVPGSYSMNPECVKCLKAAADFYGYHWPKEVQDDMYIINTCEEVFDDEIWTGLPIGVASKMAESVVAIASFIGDRRAFACTGVFIDDSKVPQGYQRIMTSGSLVRPCEKPHEKFRIEVHLLNKRRATGKLVHHNHEYNISLVDIKESVCHPVIKLNESNSVTPDTAVVAVGCLFDECRLMATNGVVTGEDSILDGKHIQISTCKIKKAGIGGPLFDTSGNFVGINLYGAEKTPFVPVSMLMKYLENNDGNRSDAANIIVNTGDNRWYVPDPQWCYPQRKEEVLEHTSPVDH